MKYQIIADESVDFKIVLQLREVGFITYSIMEEQPSLKDEDVLSIACENDALLITEDKDFGELVFRLRLPHKGILLIRINEKEIKIALVVQNILKSYTELLNKFSVIDNNKLRIKD
jgi:predicted nuclease of predicted toxin-antitoxin system